MKFYRDNETCEIVTEEQLRAEFDELKREQPEEYDYPFARYLRNITDKNGMMEEVKNMTVCIKSHNSNGIICTLDLSEAYGKNIYTVTASEEIDEQRAQSPFARAVYTESERAKAEATYNRYIRKYCKEAQI
mgnify:CR=1 FL=1